MRGRNVGGAWAWASKTKKFCGIVDLERILKGRFARTTEKEGREATRRDLNLNLKWASSYLLLLISLLSHPPDSSKSR
jgi:hypothetical protein